MAQYLLSVWHDEDFSLDDEPPENFQEIVDGVDRFNQDLMASGAWVFAGGLMPAAHATVVAPGDGDVSITDGPYAESKEVMGGFWIVELADLDAALALAREASAACQGPVEVRPFQPEPDDA